MLCGKFMFRIGLNITRPQAACNPDNHGVGPGGDAGLIARTTHMI